jgi:hypothetical protein
MNPTHFDRVVQNRTVSLPMGHVTVHSHPDVMRRPGLTVQVDSEARPPRCEYQELASTQLVSMNRMQRRYYEVKDDDSRISGESSYYSPSVSLAKRTPAAYKNFSARAEWSKNAAGRDRDYGLNSSERFGAPSHLVNMHRGTEQRHAR